MTTLPISIPNDADYPRWSETLRDRSVVLIRPIAHEDMSAERYFIEGLSPETNHFRFMGQIGTPSDSMLAGFTDVDRVHDVAFVAVVTDDSHERIVGVSRYSTDADTSHCECAVTVADAWQDKGLGTILMQHLIAIAKARGIHTMYSIDWADNNGMRELATYLGFSHRTDPDDARQVIHELPL